MTERDIFIAALQQPGPAERAAYLDGACGGDQALRGLVEELLREQEQLGSFLERPAEDRGTGPFTPVSGEKILTTSAERPGTVIGPYKLLQQIGEGGMGTVYMAEQTQPVQRKVALKVIKAGMDSRQVIARFEAERQALAMMDHVNIARVLDAGATESGLPYFVMELVHGVPITKYCDDNKLTPRERLELFVPVCQAIQHAHQKGVIHRDVKPSNVMVTLYDGKPVPKVIDFGIAKATEQKLTERTLFTQYGTMVGTLEYMSPEQAGGEAVDQRTDLFSLGSVLYAMSTGRPPFRADSGMAVLKRVCDDTPSAIRETNPDLPDWLVAIVTKLHCKNPADRFQSAAEVAELLKDHLAHLQHPSVVGPVAGKLPSLLGRGAGGERAVGQPASRRRRWALAAAALLLCLVGGFEFTEAAGVTSLQATVIRIFTPEGTLIVEVDDPGVKVTIEGDGGIVITGAGPQDVRLRPGSYKVRATKDGKPIRDEELVTITRGDKQVVKVSQELPGQALALGEIRRFVGHTGGVQSVAISSDGRRVLSGSDDKTVRLWDLNTGKELGRFEGHSDKVYSVAFSPDGGSVLSGSLDTTVRLWDVETRKELRCFTGHTDSVACVAFSPDGRRALSGGNDKTLRLRDVKNGKELRRFEGHTREIYSVAFSPDGRRALSDSWD